MLRLPRFRFASPSSAREAAALAAESPRAMFVAGGTDLYPKLKRRQFDPDLLIGLGLLPGARQVHGDAESGFRLGAGVTLREVSDNPALTEAHPGYVAAAQVVSSPPLRNVGTVGGNLLVDPRCNYYDQTYDWRKAAGFCLKKDGDICLVAPGSPRCWAVSSTDTAPMAMALDASVVLVGPEGERELPLRDLYRDDGIDYVTKERWEVLAELRLPPADGLKSAYVKLRRRGSIDFPIAGAAVALRLEGGRVSHCRIVLVGVGSHPVEAAAASEFLIDQKLDLETIAHAAELAAKPGKPLDNADLSHFWRKRMLRPLVEQAVTEAGKAA